MKIIQYPIDQKYVIRTFPPRYSCTVCKTNDAFATLIEYDKRYFCAYSVK